MVSGERRSVCAKTRKEVTDKLRELRNVAEQGTLTGTKQQTVAQFLDGWLEDVVKVNNAYKTHRSYREQGVKHIAPALGRHRLDKLTAQHIQTFLNTQRESSLSARTVAYQRAILRSALNQAIEWRLITYNAAAVAKPSRQDRKQVQALSLDEAKAILSVFEGSEMEMLVRTALMLGLRRGELLGLRWSDVDLDTGVLHVRHQVQKQDGVWRFVPPNSKESRRTVPILRFLVTELRAYRTRQLESRLQAGPAWEDFDLVFPSAVGTPPGRDARAASVPGATQEGRPPVEAVPSPATWSGLGPAGAGR